MLYKDMDKKMLIEILEYKDNLIKKLKNEKRRLDYYARVDCLTGTLNRRAGIYLLKRNLQICKINKSNLTIGFIDIDKLKEINDIFGHKEGDRVLKCVSNIIKQNIRDKDIIFRMGGDEFIVIFSGLCIKDAKKIWNKISMNINFLNKTELYRYKLSVSCGFSNYPMNNKMSIKDFIQKADKEMYKNKYNKKLESILI